MTATISAQVHQGWADPDPNLHIPAVSPEAVLLVACRKRITEARPELDKRGITEDEVMLLQAIAYGMTLDEASRMTGLPFAVCDHVLDQIFKKLAVNRPLDAIRRGVQLGLVAFP